MSREYTWDEQFKIGTDAEQVLDSHFSQTYHIRQATPEQQRQGIDRVFWHKVEVMAGTKLISKFSNGFSVEYKADAVAERTKNIFVETEIEKNGKTSIGWAPKMMAQALVILLPKQGLVWWCDVMQLKELLQHWGVVYSISPWVENRGGLKARGLLVPVKEFQTGCVYNVEKLRVL